MDNLLDEIKYLLKDISQLTSTEKRCDRQTKIDYKENPLNPNLLAYCFDRILGFDVRYRVFEKVNYFIEFEYKDTYAYVAHEKMSYNVWIEDCYKDEIIQIFMVVKNLLEKLFLRIGEASLEKNEFSMRNEAVRYLDKLLFCEKKVESLKQRYMVVSEKLRGQYDVEECEPYGKVYKLRGSDYLRSVRSEMTYWIESYIDTFFSALEHVLILLFPFTEKFDMGDSLYKKYIRNTRWHWDEKIKDVCGDKIDLAMLDKLREIKEIYRNYNAHGSFSREMMAYIQIPSFGRYPLYIGKNYLCGFAESEESSVTYEVYLEVKDVFNKFWEVLEKEYEIPMLFIKSGLPIPVNTESYIKDIATAEEAEMKILRLWFEIDNQSNMDW